ncbi:MAG TPA: LysR substrate-binding domain-containing protein [Acidimicrobiales bacterium]|jgi:DNA-binding transcriptional LysR family regulator|nr:LysR substrate-binding domain-containing protein [Acidimicrobiales bacterium]
MESQRLRHFIAVADHGGFTAAAQAVYVSQPALSLAVKELEAELGAQLFTRTGRQVRLTAAGEALLGPARQVVRDLDTGQAAVAAVIGLDAGSLSLACLPTLVADPVAPLVGAFRRAHPGVRIELAAPEDTGDLFDLVASGTCELGVTEAHGVPTALRAHTLGRQSLVLILPPDTQTTRRTRKIPLAQLAGMPLVVAPPGTSTRRLLDEGFAAAGVQPSVAVVTAQRDAILPLVIAGAGAALVPRALARTAQGLGAAVARPDPPIERELALVYRAGPLSPAAARFTDLATATQKPARQPAQRAH